MPVAVKPEEVPVFVRAGIVTKYADIFNYTTKWLSDPKRSTKEAQQFTGDDGVTVENWGQIATGLRRVAKDLGVRLTLVFKDGVLWAKHGGEYVPLTAEQVESRRLKRESNKAIKAEMESRAAAK